jgi:hypothetical protein
MTQPFELVVLAAGSFIGLLALLLWVLAAACGWWPSTDGGGPVDRVQGGA